MTTATESPGQSMGVPGELPAWDESVYLKSAFDDAAIGMSIASLNWRLLRVNAAHVRMLGYSEHELLTTDFRTRIHPDDLAPNDVLRRDLFAGAINSYETERRYIHRDGHLVWCLVTVSLIRDDEGTPLYFVGQMQDITERKLAEESLRQSEQRMARVLASASDGMLIVNQHGMIVTTNPAVERISGVTVETLVGMPVTALADLLHQDGSPPCIDIEPVFRRALETGEATTGVDIAFTRLDGEVVYGILDVVPLQDDNYAQDGILLTIHDVTARKHLEQRLEHLALHDPLTNLPNRRLFEDRAEQALIAAQRGGDQVGILLIDLDNFKPVNDRYGHAAGDAVLIELARRLTACVREEDTVARVGGDEFVILLRSVRDVAEISAVRDRLIDAIAIAHLIEGRPVVVTGSVGMSYVTSPNDTVSDLLNRADEGMYGVKYRRRLRLVKPHDHRQPPILEAGS